jgi:DNA-binding LacI/PurR family transcriptional regulator
MDVAASFWPPLTTVRQDFSAVGRLSIQKLLAKVSDATTEADTTVVATELVIRGSTAPPPAAMAEEATRRNPVPAPR